MTAHTAEACLPDHDEDFNAMVEACTNACEAVLRIGTPEMQSVARLLLLLLGRELAEREAADPSMGADHEGP